ncbi:hypothetical protein Bca52824_053919 [Brassica carinata]|uniref:RNase H type-1 domain-containing protein n=1 Tax=Brassica carinata TaxID=52824 RepID=A0A8X7RCK9_BRACI|nr:hypothetical protein Bca52824_053919 [Brassica carinata]
MIKSVAVSTPIYSMSHFKLPVATTQEIDAILMRFWWGKNDLKGLPWVAWKKLQSRKQSLLAGNGWASLLAGIEVLKKGCRYIVGNGKDIRVFKDNWLPVISPRLASTTINCDLLVSDLITTSPYKHWNPVALHQIYLSQTEKEDKLIWSHTRDGDYTVSSGYKVARHAPEFLIEAPPIPYDQGFLKCNYDAAYDLNSNQVRGAWIIPNCYSHPYMWGSAYLGFSNSSLVAETMALLVAMQNVWIGGYSNMIFEGDSEILVKTINDQLTNSTIHNLLEKITSLKNKLSTTTFTFVKRNGNQAAHEIVRHVPINSIFENCKVYPPKWLTPTLYSDIMLSY